MDAVFLGKYLQTFDNNIIPNLSDLQLFGDLTNIPNITSFSNNQLPALTQLTIPCLNEIVLKFKGNNLTSLLKLRIMAKAGVVFEGNELSALTNLLIEGNLPELP